MRAMPSRESPDVIVQRRAENRISSRVRLRELATLVFDGLAYPELDQIDSRI